MNNNNVFIVTQSKQDPNYIKATTKLDNVSFDYSVITAPGCATTLKNNALPVFLGEKKKINEVRRVLGLC